MICRIDLTESAESDVENALEWIRRRSEEEAANWLDAFESSLASLENLPNRCPIARETHSFLIDIRNLFFGKGSLQYRIIFGISVDENSGEDVVTIYRVRNSMQRPLSGSEIFGATDDI